MICLFSLKNSANLEDFRKSLTSQIKLLIGLEFIGAFTCLLCLLSECTSLFKVSEYISGFLLGFGMALIAISTINIIRKRKILKDEALLKKERLKYTDERNVLINTQATEIATLVLLFTLYICFIICLFLNPKMAILLGIPIFIFILSFSLARYYFNKKF